MVSTIPLLDYLFNTRNVAIIGASADSMKTGGVIFNNLIKDGYTGNVFPVNPRYEEIGGKKCYSSISEIREKIDLAIIVLKAELVSDAVKQCVKKEVEYAVIISGGFSETGDAGKKLESELLKIIEGTGTRIIGPNTVGIYLPYMRLNTSLTPADRVNFPGEGRIALVSQSGALGLLLMDEMSEMGTGVSCFLNLGNRIDLDESDLLQYFESDNRTDSIMMYIESVADGRKFYNALKAVTRLKPTVVLKSGITETSARAAMLHTGAMSSDDAIFDGVLKQAGAVRASNETELYDFARVLAYNPEMRGKRVAVITTAGGAGVVSTDLLTSMTGNGKLELSTFSDSTKSAIKSLIVPFASAANPVDITAEGSVDTYEKILEILVRSEEVDAILAFALPQTARMNESIVPVIKKYSKFKPIVVSIIGSKLAIPLLRKFEGEGIAAYPSITRAVESMKALHSYYRMRGGSGD